jgi:hypothetical protein
MSTDQPEALQHRLALDQLHITLRFTVFFFLVSLHTPSTTALKMASMQCCAHTHTLVQALVFPEPPLFPYGPGGLDVLGCSHQARCLSAFMALHMHACIHAGAMENWGLITFRETDLLAPNGRPDDMDSAISHNQPSISQLYAVPLTVAHEVAHMWFGEHFFHPCSSARRHSCWPAYRAKVLAHVLNVTLRIPTPVAQSHFAPDKFCWGLVSSQRSSAVGSSATL